MLYSHDKYRAVRKLVLIVIGILTIIPLAPLINRYIPPLMVGSWNLDLAFSVLLAAVSTYLILRLFHFLMIPALLLCAGVLFYNQFTDGYGFKRMINDYRSMVVDNWGKKEQKEIDLVLTDRKSTRLNSSHSQISYAVFCLKKKKTRGHSQ